MAKYSVKPLDFSKLNTYSLNNRHSKVSVEDFARPVQAGMNISEFINCLPNQLSGADFPEFIRRVANTVQQQKTVIMGMGAHVIKVGLNPILIDLMERGIISSIALNGAGIIHDSEIAMVGRTSEDVAEVLGQGAFGAAKETGEFLNQAINHGAKKNTGMGETVGQALLDAGFSHNSQSILAQACKLNIPVTVHVAMGTDIIHIHPDADGAAIGKTSHIDFKIFSSLVSNLQDGVYCNIGSAVLLPEVFLKALTVVRNLGHKVKNITTANFDFIRHYRPAVNVVHRPVLESGRGFNFTGHHELMIPLFAAALLDKLSECSMEKNRK